MLKDTNYVVVLPNNEEVFVDNPREDNAKDVCQSVVWKSHIRTKRSNPQSIRVTIYSIKLVRGEAKRFKIGDYSVMPSCERMTQEEFEQETNDDLKEFPEEFQSFIMAVARDHGSHSSLEDTASDVSSIAYHFKLAFDEYQKRMAKN